MWEERLRWVLLALFFISFNLSVAVQQTVLGLLLAFGMMFPRRMVMLLIYS